MNVLPVLNAVRAQGGGSADPLLDDLNRGLSIFGADVSDSLARFFRSLVGQEEAARKLAFGMLTVMLALMLVIVVLIIFFTARTVHRIHVSRKRRQDFLQSLTELDDEERERLRVLAARCERLGRRIDRHTDRPANSRKVSDVVLRMSRAMGMPQQDVALCYCAAMVYDAGFLAVPDDIFRIEILSAQERDTMKEHVGDYAEFLDFVPGQYGAVFADAAAKHHENMDGSGYPHALGGNDIPQVARLIHAAESYVSLVSRRLYHKPLDKAAAVAELRGTPGKYDDAILSVLEQVV